MINRNLTRKALPLQLPIGVEEDFIGVVDLLKMKAFTYHDEMGLEIEERINCF